MSGPSRHEILVVDDDAGVRDSLVRVTVPVLPQQVRYVIDFSLSIASPLPERKVETIVRRPMKIAANT